MPKIKKTLDNPYGLSTKQRMVIEEVKAKVSRGEKFSLFDATQKYYNAKDKRNVEQVVIYNNHNQNFREALVASLTEKNIIGANSKTEDRLLEGLDAEGKDGSVDYEARLKYIQEIHKITGMYAPEVKKNLNLNLDMSEDELDTKIEELKKQLE